jgi:hypothetical protein
MESGVVLLGVIPVVLLVWLLQLSRKVAALSAAYRQFMQGRDGASLEGVLASLNRDMAGAQDLIEADRDRLREVEAVLDTAVRGVGVVRFNAFQDTGSDLSFAVALLDAGENGLVVSSIYGREESRTYAKPVREGKSPYQLSGEEQEAIRRAKAVTRHLASRTK